MANVKATTISNGVNTAFIPNALKVENERLVLYNDENDLFRSAVNLEDLQVNSGNTGFDPRTRVIYASDFITEAEATSNCTVQINSLVEEVYDNGGGVIKFDGIIYRFSGLIMYSNVYLEGCGIGNTIFQRLSNTQVGDIVDQYADNATGFINIPKHVSNFGISNMTIYGNIVHSLNNTDGIDYYTEGETNIINGILIEDCDTATSYTNTTGKVIDNDVLYTRNVIPLSNELRVNKYANIENIACIGFTGCGIYVGRYNQSLTFKNILCQSNLGIGFFNYSDHNSFINLDIKFNGKDGISNKGSNNKWLNIKSTWNGFYNHWSWGISTEGNKDHWVNVEVQDNWCNGMLIKGDAVNTTNLLIDTNGYRSANDSNGKNMLPQDCTMLSMQGCNKCIINANICNYRNDLGMVAKMAFEVISSSTHNIINITQDDAVFLNKSNVNGIEITDSITNDTIADNLIRCVIS